MNTSVNPFFEVDGKKYEIKPNRELQCFFDCEMKSSSDDIDKKSAAKAFSLSQEYQNAIKLFEQAKKEYYEDPLSDDKKKKYDAYFNIYLDLQERFVAFEAENETVTASQKKVIDILEKTLIEALHRQYGLDLLEATTLWENYVDEIGTENAEEWLGYFHEVLFQKEEKKSPFLEIMRKKRKQ